MAKDYTGHVQMIGDFGNPSGTGVAKLVVDQLPVADDVATMKVRLKAFADALATEQFTACVAGDYSIKDTEVNFQTKPGVDANVDRQMVVTWRQKSLSPVHKLTISGVPEGSPVTAGVDRGERITEAGKATLAGLINTLYGLIDDVVVLTGKVIQKV
jgi:hypothetical protein